MVTESLQLRLVSPERLTKPLICRNGKLQESTWDEAMGLFVQRSKQLLDETKGLGIGIYSTGQIFLEEYYTLALLGKGRSCNTIYKTLMKYMIRDSQGTVGLLKKSSGSQKAHCIL